MRRVDTPTDSFFNAMSKRPGMGLVFIALYGTWLVGWGIWGAVVERRFMTRELP